MHLCIFWFFLIADTFQLGAFEEVGFWEIADVACTLGVLSAWRYREQARSHRGMCGMPVMAVGQLFLMWLVVRYREQARSHSGGGGCLLWRWVS
ncbi:hypothetical protein APS14_24285 [Pseudomonas thivervalensis]|nr:hypothetical protein APS14_24285 [Pseudomonas thivervalensis]